MMNLNSLLARTARGTKPVPVLEQAGHATGAVIVEETSSTYIYIYIYDGNNVSPKRSYLWA